MLQLLFALSFAFATKKECPYYLAHSNPLVTHATSKEALREADDWLAALGIDTYPEDLPNHPDFQEFLRHESSRWQHLTPQYKIIESQRFLIEKWDEWDKIQPQRRSADLMRDLRVFGLRPDPILFPLNGRTLLIAQSAANLQEWVKWLELRFPLKPETLSARAPNAVADSMLSDFWLRAYHPAYNGVAPRAPLVSENELNKVGIVSEFETFHGNLFGSVHSKALVLTASAAKGDLYSLSEVVPRFQMVDRAFFYENGFVLPRFRYDAEVFNCLRLRDPARLKEMPERLAEEDYVQAAQLKSFRSSLHRYILTVPDAELLITIAGRRLLLYLWETRNFEYEGVVERARLFDGPQAFYQYNILPALGVAGLNVWIPPSVPRQNMVLTDRLDP